LEKPEISSIFDHLAQHQKLIEFLIKRDYLTAHWGPSLLADFDKLSGEKKASIRTGLNALAGQLVGIRAKHFVKERGASPSF
jgi:hypothetical protein